MGADWVRFRIPAELNIEHVRERAHFVSTNYGHGHQYVLIPKIPDDEATRERFSFEFSWLESHLDFPLPTLDYWSHRTLTDPLRLESEEDIGVIDACRVYVISHNPIFPVEWRDGAYRTILPDELATQVKTWNRWIEEVRSGQWLHYLYDLYFFDRINDDHQFQEIELLYSDAQASLTRTNAWCLKAKLQPVRDRILSSALTAQLAAMREHTACPVFAEASRFQEPTTEQLEREAQLVRLCRDAAEQIREWNRCVPGKLKRQFPIRQTFDDFRARAEDSWLGSFLLWCHYLMENDYGLYLWA